MKIRTGGRLFRAPAPPGLTARLMLAVALGGVLAVACDVHTPTGPGTLASLTVSPDVTLAVSAKQQFVAVGRDAEGTVIDISPDWTIIAGGGAIDKGGLFTAGMVPGTYTATVQATDGDLSGTATVTVTIGPVATIEVTPNPTLGINATQQFTAVGKDVGGNLVAISPVWSVVASGGVISSAGLFTAGAATGIFAGTVKATDSSGVSGTATVTVIAGPLATIQVTPNPQVLAANAAQQFTAVGRDAGGNVVPITPVWTVVASGGSISSSGLFVAGGSGGTFVNTVRAVASGASGFATIVVTVAAPPPPPGPGPLSTLEISPNPKTLGVGETQQFTAIGRDAGGTVVSIFPAAWTLISGGGSISGSGLFTAGPTAGTFTNTVRAISGTASAVATVIVTSTGSPPPPAAGPLATIQVMPNPETLGVSETQQFTAVGMDANGNIITISPTWAVVANGGSINSSGLFTAGTAAGTFPNTVRATSGSVSGFATVIVTAAPTPPPPPGPGPLATIEVTPNPETLGVSETQQFTAIGRDASGTIVTITPSWTIVNGGGTIGGGGLFTAGTVAGTFSNTVRATSGSISGFATVNVTATPPPPPTPVTVNLGAAATHGILAGSTITCVALGTVNADASVWPGSAITGFPPCVITGARHAADAFAQTAQAALTVAYNQLDAMACGATITSNLGGQTLQPGVYCSTSTVGLTGEMFLNGLGDPNALFVIKAASSLTTAAAQVTLVNGAQAKNVFWLVGSSATLGVGSAMKGNIITLTSITIVDNSTIIGRALARNGAVTLGTSNTITLP